MRRCEPCGQMIAAGDLVRHYDDIGEAHVDCDDPTGAAFADVNRIPADPDEWEPGEAPTFLRTSRSEG